MHSDPTDSAPPNVDIEESAAETATGSVGGDGDLTLDGLRERITAEIDSLERQLLDLVAEVRLPEPEVVEVPVLEAPSAADTDLSDGAEDLLLLRQAAASIDAATNQGEILSRLLELTAGEDGRAAMLLCPSEHDAGERLSIWNAAGFDGDLAGTAVEVPDWAAPALAGEAPIRLGSGEASLLSAALDGSTSASGLLVPFVLRDTPRALLLWVSDDEQAASSRSDLIQTLTFLATQCLEALGLRQDRPAGVLAEAIEISADTSDEGEEDPEASTDDAPAEVPLDTSAPESTVTPGASGTSGTSEDFAAGSASFEGPMAAETQTATVAPEVAATPEVPATPEVAESPEDLADSPEPELDLAQEGGDVAPAAPADGLATTLIEPAALVAPRQVPAGSVPAGAETESPAAPSFESQAPTAEVTATEAPADEFSELGAPTMEEPTREPTDPYGSLANPGTAPPLPADDGLLGVEPTTAGDSVPSREVTEAPLVAQQEPVGDAGGAGALGGTAFPPAESAFGGSSFPTARIEGPPNRLSESRSSLTTTASEHSQPLPEATSAPGGEPALGTTSFEMEEIAPTSDSAIPAPPVGPGVESSVSPDPTSFDTVTEPPEEIAVEPPTPLEELPAASAFDEAPEVEPEAISPATSPLSTGAGLTEPTVTSPPPPAAFDALQTVALPNASAFESLAARTGTPDPSPVNVEPAGFVAPATPTPIEPPAAPAPPDAPAPPTGFSSPVVEPEPTTPVSAPPGTGFSRHTDPPAQPPRSSSEVSIPEDISGPGLAFRAGEASQPVVAASSGPAHDEARRLARLLVSEIKLYNEDQIDQGIREGNIYRLLREDIDRSKRMYEERIDGDLLQGTDYFREELVRSLARGNAAVLGL